MKASKRKKLEKAGWKVGSASDFLDLSEAEEILVNIKLLLASEVKGRRQRLKLTQEQLAKRLGSSQSRVAKIELADPSVSLDLVVRSMASLGATQEEIGAVIGNPPQKKRKPSGRKQNPTKT